MSWKGTNAYRMSEARRGGDGVSAKGVHATRFPPTVGAHELQHGRLARSPDRKAERVPIPSREHA